MLHEIVSFFSRHLREVISQCNMESSDRRRACECAPTSCRRMDERIGMHHTLPDFLSRNKCRDRHHSPSERFAHRHDIGNNSPIIYTPHLASASDSCLYLIGNEENSMFRGSSSDAWPEVIRRYDRSCLTLDRFHHHCSNPDSDGFTDLQLSLDCCSIPERNMIYWSTVELAYWFSVFFFSDE